MTTPNPFQQPDKGDRFTPRDHANEWINKLFLFYPDSVSQQMGTNAQGQPEPYETVEADIVIIDLVDPETGQPKTLSNARVGGKALVPQIKKHCGGGMVLGRLAQTAAQGQKSGAFYLAEYNDADVQMATQYINTHPRNAFTQPSAQAAPAAAPPQQQWGQQPAPQYDVWQHTQAAPAPAVQAAPAGPPQGQWGTPPAGQQPLPQGAPSNGAATAAPVAAAPGSPAPQWGAPAASPQAAPAQAAPASPSAPQQWGAPQAATPAPAAPQPAPTALDPGLVAFLRSKGVDNPEGLTPDNAQLLANHYQQQAQQPPF